MSVEAFLDRLDSLEQSCQETLSRCIECDGESNYHLTRCSFTIGLNSIRYGVCQNCRDSAASERLIENEMRSSFLANEAETLVDFKLLLEESFGQDWW
jgi:hypothetical protein